MKTKPFSSFSTKTFFPALLVTMLFVFGVSDAFAQQTTTKDYTYSVPQGNFVNVSEAIIRLNAALENLKASMATLDPQSLGFKTMDMRYIYFERIKTILEEGKGTDSATVANAIASAIVVLSADGNNTLGTKDIYAFKQDAINLLRQ